MEVPKKGGEGGYLRRDEAPGLIVVFDRNGYIGVLSRGKQL